MSLIDGDTTDECFVDVSTCAVASSMDVPVTTNDSTLSLTLANVTLKFEPLI